MVKCPLTMRQPFSLLVFAALTAGAVNADKTSVGRVTFPESRSSEGMFIMETNGVPLRFFNVKDPNSALFRAGDRIRTKWHVEIDDNGNRCRQCSEIEILGHEPPPPPTVSTIRGLSTPTIALRPAKIRGTVKDVFRDELQPSLDYLILVDETGEVYTPITDRNIPNRPKDLIGCTLEAVGIYTPYSTGTRRMFGGIFMAYGANCVRVIEKPDTDLFDVPELGSIRHLPPEAIGTLGRRKAVGSVLAVWNRDRMLIRTPGDEIMRVELNAPEPPPIGERIEAVGFPETELYHVNLIRACWKKAVGSPPPSSAPDEMIGDDKVELILDNHGISRIDPKHHGRTLRIVGVVRARFDTEQGDTRLHLETHGILLPVLLSDTAGIDKFTLGSKIAVLGVYVAEFDPWRRNATFPEIRSALLVPRSSRDIVVLEPPSWWTPERAVATVALLLAVILLSFVVIALMKRILIRRERELEREISARLGYALKTEERTRLAIELHDSLSQTMSGVSMRIDAAKRALATNAERALNHLEIGAKTLKNCREELKNCLWDLRNNTIDEPIAGEAIRRTLLPFGDAAKIVIRFNVPRELISDNTMHAIIRIVRELVTNAIRHGGAKTIRIAGERENGRLRLSVQDDGRGFAPEEAPGIGLGHFGLEGIRERIASLGGSITVNSAPGKGCKIRITL